MLTIYKYGRRDPDGDGVRLSRESEWAEVTRGEARQIARLLLDWAGT